MMLRRIAIVFAGWLALICVALGGTISIPFPGPGGSVKVSYGVSLDGSTKYLSRTPGVAGNQQLAAFSIWLKRKSTGSTQTIYAQGTTGTNVGNMEVRFTSSDQIAVTAGSGINWLVSTATFTDTASWHNLVFHFDGNNATASLRIRVFWDGSEITSWGTDNRGSIVGATNYSWNSASLAGLGRSTISASNFLNANIAQFYTFDGVALSGLGPSTFYSGGLPVTSYAGSYGTNGAKLFFATAASLGSDTSGNGNNYTANSITSGDQITNGP